MKSLGSLAFLAALVFYVAWPVYSAVEIKGALDERDAARLSAKVDFPLLRTSLRPAVTKKVEKMLVETLRKAGPAAGSLTDQLRGQIMPPIVDSVLAALVTPEAIIRVHASGATIKDAIDGMVAEQASNTGALQGLLLGGSQDGSADSGLDGLRDTAKSLGIDPDAALGGLFGSKPGPAKTETPAKPEAAPRYGFENIKDFSLSGPLGVSVSVAKNPKARKPDLTAEMRFVDGDWKLTGLVPRL
jgi:Protein of unknown function (DUF2939)